MQKGTWQSSLGMSANICNKDNGNSGNFLYVAAAARLPKQYPQLCVYRMLTAGVKTPANA